MKVTELDLPKEGKINHYFIISDWHSFHYDKPTIDIAVKHAKMFPKKERRLIINGDFLDCHHLMERSAEFKRYKKRVDGIEEYFLPQSELEFGWGNEMLDSLQKVFSEIIYIDGNHDWRYWSFKDGIHCPIAYAHNFDIKKQLSLHDRGILHIAYNDWLDIGSMTITHGMYHGTTAHKRHYEACGKSVIFGHIHRFEAKSFISRGKTKTAYSLPAACKLNPNYIKNSDNNWTNGYGTLHVKSCGHFNYHTHTIWDNELILPNGKVLKSSSGE